MVLICFNNVDAQTIFLENSHFCHKPLTEVNNKLNKSLIIIPHVSNVFGVITLRLNLK